jgi:flagellar L-ring protein precursor FlgH
MKHAMLTAITLAAVATGGSPARAESLFDEATFRPLAADNKAYRAGDVITVHVYESSSASTSADTSTERKNGLDAGLRLTPGREFGGGLSVGSDFSGGGATQRANRLLATVTATVVEVLPNGDLQLAGEQVLTVNEEKHKVSVEGRVRPQDVSADNVVLSTRMAGARIQYVGDGEVSGRQRPGWWRRLLDWVGL